MSCRMTGVFSSYFQFQIEFFSDFVPTTPRVKPPPSLASFPLPEAFLSNREEIVTYARQILNFVVPARQKRGEGELKQWGEKVQASSLSEATMSLLKLAPEDQISLEDVRPWKIGMKIGANFRVGPPGGRKDSLWKIPMTWPKFLRLIIEVFTILYGKEEELCLVKDY